MSCILSQIEKIIENEGLTTSKMEKIIGASKGVLSRAIKNQTDIQSKWLQLIIDKFPHYSTRWLLTGEGQMLVSDNDCHNTITNIDDNEYSNDNIVEELPIIPANIVNEPKVDVYEYIFENETDMAPVVQQFPQTTAYYRIKSKAMEPNICSGDVLALQAYPIGEEFIVPGEPYVIDTNTNGLVTRLLYPRPDGYAAVTYCNERYPEFFIPKKHIIRIYRIVGLLRTNVQ